MKKTDQAEFADFMLNEAMKFGRAITTPEVDTWYETFRRTTLPDFKAAWIEHKRDAKRGGYFPTINDLQRILRTTGEEQVARDWRCAEEVSGQRCGFPGAIKIQGTSNYHCSAHYRIKGTENYSESASLQIIELSRAYVPPKTTMELMERGSAQRTVEGARWRKAHGVEAAKRRPEDVITPSVKAPEDRVADAHVASTDQRHVDELNAALAIAGDEDGA